MEVECSLETQRGFLEVVGKADLANHPSPPAPANMNPADTSGG